MGNRIMKYWEKHLQSVCGDDKTLRAREESSLALIPFYVVGIVVFWIICK